MKYTTITTFTVMMFVLFSFSFSDAFAVPPPLEASFNGIPQVGQTVTMSCIQNADTTSLNGVLIVKVVSSDEILYNSNYGELSFTYLIPENLESEEIRIICNSNSDQNSLDVNILASPIPTLEAEFSQTPTFGEYVTMSCDEVGNPEAPRIIISTDSPFNILYDSEPLRSLSYTYLIPIDFQSESITITCYIKNPVKSSLIEVSKLELSIAGTRDPNPVDGVTLNVNDRIKIDSTNSTTIDGLPLNISSGDQFGYDIENIGDLDGDGVIDLAVIKHLDDSAVTNAGSVLIMFMNDDGSVKDQNEITMDITDSGIGSSCIVGDGTNVKSFASHVSLEELAFVGDLNNNGKPTLALGVPRSDHNGLQFSGAVYMLELNSDGTVDNCLRIIPSENNFNPADKYYLEDGDGFLGMPLFVTDLNGDGQNELIVGASDEADATTNLWVLFLNSNGSVANHPAIPIFGVTDLKITSNDTNNHTNNPIDRDYIIGGDSVNGGTKIVIGVPDADEAEKLFEITNVEHGAIWIINLTPTGEHLTSKPIMGPSLGQGIVHGDEFGTSVIGVGDLDGDGINDIMVGNDVGDDTNGDSGEAYILFLNSDDSVRESQKISNESENTRNDSTPFASNDNFGKGMGLWRTDGGETVIAIGAVGDGAGAIHLFYINDDSQSEDAKKNGGSGDNKHETRPTFGFSHSIKNMALVECGYSHNADCYDITNNWHTPFEKVEIKTGVPQEIILKGYFPNGVKEFGWGLVPEIGKFDKAEVKIQVEINHLDDIENIDTYQKHNIINMTNIVYEYYQESCGYINSKCDVLKMSNVTFMVEPVFERIAIHAVDDQRRTQLTTLNEGYDIFGDSLNEPLESKVSVGKGGSFYPQRAGQVELKLINYKTNTWQDEYGYLWQGDNYKSFKIISTIPVPIPAPDKIGTTIDRGHSEFYRITDYELKRALEIFDSSKLISELPESIPMPISLVNIELEALKTEYNKQVEAYKAENYLLYSLPPSEKIFKKYQIEHDQLNKKYEDSLSSLLLQIKELE